MSSKKYCHQIAVLICQLLKTLLAKFSQCPRLTHLACSLHHQGLPSLALFPSLQFVKYISCNFHSYEFVAKLHIFPMKNVELCTFLVFIGLVEHNHSVSLTFQYHYTPSIVKPYTKLGIITSEMLSKYRKHSFLIIMLVAAIITPPDLMTLILVTIPPYLLYEISIRVVRWGGRGESIGKDKLIHCCPVKIR